MAAPSANVRVSFANIHYSSGKPPSSGVSSNVYAQFATLFCSIYSYIVNTWSTSRRNCCSTSQFTLINSPVGNPPERYHKLFFLKFQKRLKIKTVNVFFMVYLKVTPVPVRSFSKCHCLPHHNSEAPYVTS